MFGGTKAAAPETEVGGIRRHQIATNEQARPLVVFGGLQRVPATFLTDAMNVRLDAIHGSSGKGKSTIGNDVHADFALLHCRGPVDRIEKILVDGREEWGGAMVRDIFNPDKVTISMPVTRASQVELFWGTATQAASANLAAWDTNTHPAYRGQCYSVWGKHWYIGRNRDSVPNIELVLGRYPRPSWWPGALAVNIKGDVNAAAFIGDFLQDTLVGLGWPDSRLDIPSFIAVGTQLVAEELGISPLITKTQSWRQALTEIMAYIDGYWTTTKEGKFAIGLVRPAGSLVTIDESKIVGKPETEAGAWTRTVNRVSIAFSNREIDYESDAIHFTDRANFQITGTVRHATHQRPWITRREVAERVALALGAKDGLPALTGSLAVRKSAGKALTPGTAFALTYGDHGLSATTVRVKEQTLPAPNEDPSVRLTWEVDRSYLNGEHYLSADPTPSTPTAPSPATPYQRVVEAPWQPEFNVPQVWALLTRTSLAAAGFFAHLQKPSTEYELRGYVAGFAIRGHVVDANYPVTEMIDSDLGMIVLIDSVDENLEIAETLADALLGNWLAVVGDEVCGVFGVELIGTSKYKLRLIRARYDTARAAHAIGTEVWLFQRAVQPALAAENDLELQRYKLQQVVAGEPEDLSGVAAVDLTTQDRWTRPMAPANLAAFGDGANPVYTTGQNVALTWNVTHERRGFFWELWEGGFTTDLPGTSLEFRTTGGALVKTVELPIGAAAYTLANADLVAWFGAEVSFVVRAYHRRNGYRSTLFETLSVTKV